jgi:hypothetical protein
MSEAPARAKIPELIWGGLAARCSACAWTRVYGDNFGVHRLPGEELSEVIRQEFLMHRCEERGQADQPGSLTAHYGIT